MILSSWHWTLTQILKDISLGACWGSESSSSHSQHFSSTHMDPSSSGINHCVLWGWEWCLTWTLLHVLWHDPVWSPAYTWFLTYYSTVAAGNNLSDRDNEHHSYLLFRLSFTALFTPWEWQRLDARNPDAM